ncbi:MAG TPA: hypothetical protein VFT10_09295 [Solirubrobacterales bacterium]|nr:hypothetical protein [Solirubrobacterales bacterium]
MDSDEKLELLRRFAPTLHFDALERWRPASADPYMRRSTFLDAKEHSLPGTPPAEAAMLGHLEELESRINPLPGGPDPDTQRRSNQMLATFGPEQDLATAGACYGRVIPGEPNERFLQYWLFYPDNPCVLPPGRHDGDWELVQVHLRETGDDVEAVGATLAGHGKPETRPFHSKRGGPDVYVAVDSHASYFDKGSQPTLPLSDVCTPMSPGTVPNVMPIPVSPTKVDWAHWHGRWGVDRGAGTWLALRLRLKRTPSWLRWLNKVGAGESPPSPGRQGASWSQPRIFELRGTQRRWTNVAGRRLVHFLGRLTWPRKAPEIVVAEVAPNSFTIQAQPVGHFARRVSRISVSFVEERPDGGLRALAMHSVRTGAVAGPFEIVHEGPVRWRAAGYNRLRQRGEPILPAAQ